jgi:hypothetical protein
MTVWRQFSKSCLIKSKRTLRQKGVPVINTSAEDYVVHLAGRVDRSRELGRTQSVRVVRRLQEIDPRVSTKGFRQAVLKAIFDDAVRENFFFLNDERRKKLLARLERRFGRVRTTEILVEECEILGCWKDRDSRFTPDAYLIDAEKRTVVCFEVEDANHLTPDKIIEYAAGWYTLEYIYWDLHLITYDIYGHPRVIVFPVAEFVAKEKTEERRANASYDLRHRDEPQ